MENTTPMKKLLSIPLVSALVLCSGVASAQDDQKKPYYIGVGLTSSTPDDDNNFKQASGFQIYGGYKLEQKIADMIDITIEAGFHDTGDYDGKVKIVNGNIVRDESYNSAGVWAAGVFSYAITDSFDVQGTLGLDLGDDDGVLFGGGVVYHFNDRINLNWALINRSESQSSQINVTYQF